MNILGKSFLGSGDTGSESAARVTPVECVRGIVAVWAQITQGLRDGNKNCRFSVKYDGKPLEGCEHGAM